MIALGRVVFDTSTLVSAALRSTSVPGLALLRAIEEGQLCACEIGLEELQSVLQRPKFNRYLPNQEKLEFLAMLRRECEVFPVEANHWAQVDPPSRDPKDNIFLALAVAASVETIVSSDEDLLVLHPWRGVCIVKPAVFLASPPIMFRNAAL